MKQEEAYKAMYRVLGQKHFEEAVDPDMQDEIMLVITAIFHSFDSERHSEYLRGYEEGCVDERNAVKHDLDTYRHRLGIAEGRITPPETPLNYTPMSNSKSSKRAKREATVFMNRQIG